MRFIPTVKAPFPDELLYSYIGRLARMNGLDIKNFAGMFLGIRNVDKDTLPPDGCTAFIPMYEHILSPGDMAEMYMGLTTFGFEAMALTPGQQTQYLNSVFRPDDPICAQSFPPFFQKIMLCPECAKEDLKEYGTIYFHREHNLSGVQTCPKHHVPLLENKGTPINALSFDRSSFREAGKPAADADAYADYACVLFRSGLNTDIISLQQIIVRYFREHGCTVHEGRTAIIRNLRGWEKAARWSENWSDAPVRVRLTDYRTLDLPGLIRLLMDLFPNPDSLIPLCEGHGALLNAYVCPICGETYCASPQSVHDGLACPTCDALYPAAERFDRIIQSAGNGEYELLDEFGSMHESVRLRHCCGREIRVTPEQFLFWNARCGCGASGDTPRIPDSFSASVPFTTDASRSSVTVIRNKGSLEADCAYYRFQNPPKRTVPEPGHYTQETYEASVRDLVGDKYTVIGKYTGRGRPIEIRHNECGRSHIYSCAKNFLHGVRCPDCGQSLGFVELEEKLDSYSKGRYSVSKVANGYEVFDAFSGSSVAMTETEILQEVERPTPSPILPLDGTEGDEWSPYWERMYSVLSGYYARNGARIPPASLWYEGYPLGQWAALQLRRMKEGVLPIEEETLLKNIGFKPAPPRKSNGIPASREWERRYEQYKRYVKQTESTNIPYKTIFEGEHLGAWVYDQRKKYSNGNLDAERADRLLQIDPKLFEPRSPRPWDGLTPDEKWERRFEQYKRFLKENGTTKIAHHEIYEGEELGSWINSQRKKFWAGKLGKEQTEKLLSVNPEVFDPGPRYMQSALTPEESWERNFTLYERYVKENGPASVPQGTVYGGINLYSWVRWQRERYKKGKLPEKEMSRLLSVNPDFFKADRGWSEHYRQYERYIQETGGLYVPAGTMFEGFGLGWWIREQRSQYYRGELSEERAEKLLALDPDVFALYAAGAHAGRLRSEMWERHYSQYQHYVAETGRMEVAPGTVVCGENLYNWYHYQRELYRKGALPEERAEKLQKINPDIFNFNRGPMSSLSLDDVWELRLGQYERYIEETGNYYVAYSVVYEDMCLGAWFSSQRKKYLNGELSDYRTRRLLSVNPDAFEPPRNEWQKHCEQYKRYVKETGNVEVPKRTVFEGWKIGVWVSRQIWLYNKGELPADRAAKLREVNPDIFKPKEEAP